MTAPQGGLEGALGVVGVAPHPAADAQDHGPVPPHPWWHEVRVTAVQEAVPPGHYPKVTDWVGASPPQYPDFDEEDE